MSAKNNPITDPTNDAIMSTTDASQSLDHDAADNSHSAPPVAPDIGTAFQQDTLFMGLDGSSDSPERGRSFFRRGNTSGTHAPTYFLGGHDGAMDPALSHDGAGDNESDEEMDEGEVEHDSEHEGDEEEEPQAPSTSASATAAAASRRRRSSLSVAGSRSTSRPTGYMSAGGEQVHGWWAPANLALMNVSDLALHHNMAILTRKVDFLTENTALSSAGRIKGPTVAKTKVARDARKALKGPELMTALRAFLAQGGKLAITKATVLNEIQSQSFLTFLKGHVKDNPDIEYLYTGIADMDLDGLRSLFAEISTDEKKHLAEMAAAATAAEPSTEAPGSKRHRQADADDEEDEDEQPPAKKPAPSKAPKVAPKAASKAAPKAASKPAATKKAGTSTSKKTTGRS
ncbi:hypothetical protein M438DRAFT_339892 [Aureobasidium pullulans EXF-150]|uniref:Uncharacterized protein n=1 Tax=Aureobasidium pullulans EXF-150 TaxID=1043002 RepID=A0A074XB68_AURPU|nr:uncharacterized protein M438DRAFT_339892 [Aureobasidium pullulans EXF-150]KEQ79302.1 hypothetical protein M438DRAFT_339892 [Aureobasidium pullulans EXF-150]